MNLVGMGSNGHGRALFGRYRHEDSIQGYRSWDDPGVVRPKASGPE